MICDLKTICLAIGLAHNCGTGRKLKIEDKNCLSAAGWILKIIIRKS